ncbi:MAG: hypothetical protein QF654_08780, partial [Alphaproteobacteria bacterium]|nr:hypothetical protein [Alphaproteobacteria bacterium]
MGHALAARKQSLGRDTAAIRAGVLMNQVGRDYRLETREMIEQENLTGFDLTLFLVEFDVEAETVFQHRKGANAPIVRRLFYVEIVFLVHGRPNVAPLDTLHPILDIHNQRNVCRRIAHFGATIAGHAVSKRGDLGTARAGGLTGPARLLTIASTGTAKTKRTAMSYETIEVEPLSPVIGAEISGV